MQGRQPQQAGGQRRVAVSTADEQQQVQEAHDHKLARMLQAQEYHRAQHPSHVAQGGGHGGGHGGGGHGGGGHSGGGLQAMLMGGGHGGGGHGVGHRDPAREERHRVRDEQLEMALAANPEAFVSVPMLYVQVTLNDVRARAQTVPCSPPSALSRVIFFCSAGAPEGVRGHGRTDDRPQRQGGAKVQPPRQGRQPLPRRGGWCRGGAHRRAGASRDAALRIPHRR